MMWTMVFPGQGSQSVGMLDGLDAGSKAVRETLEEASDMLGFDLGALIAHGPDDELNRTDRTQPAMLAAGVATWRAWQEAGGPAPDIMAGHSLGEYTALVCAGALGFADGLSLVEARGQFMQEAVPEGEGAMAAILGLDDDAVQDACARARNEQVLEPVNYNAPGQVVVAGHRDAVERCADAAREAGAKRAVLLPVSVPSHCSLMAPAADRLGMLLSETPLERPVIPVIHNVDLSTQDDPDAIRTALAAQLTHPVRWVETVLKMKASGARAIVEAGPGKVLTGLHRRTARDLQGLAVVDRETLIAALEAIQG